MRSRRTLGWLSFVALCACGEDEPARVPQAITPPPGCAPGEAVLDDGSCRPAGVPADECAPGFVADDGGGCSAVMPAAPCPDGWIAVPGDTSCREVAPCGAGPWAEDLPDEPGTQFVDAAFAGSSDGSDDRPWRTVQEGVDAARAGAVVAIAQGSYTEDVVIDGKSVRLWGRCPALVEIVGTDADGAIAIAGAPGTEVRRLAVRAPQKGIVVADSIDVALVELWIHDTRYWGVGSTGAAAATLRGVLVERAEAVGVFARGGDLALEASSIRDTRALTIDDKFGWGAAVSEEDGDRGRLSLSGSVVERSLDLGIGSFGGDLSLEASLVRDTRPGVASPDRGWGVVAQPHPGQRPTLAITGSVVELSRGIGVAAFGADATIATTVVRDTEPATDGSYGWAVSIQPGEGERASLELSSSLVVRAHDVAIAAFGADLVVDGVRVDDTRAGAPPGAGRGINLQDDPISGDRTVATVRASAVARSIQLGVLVYASDLVLDRSMISESLATEGGLFGDGLAVFSDASKGTATITGSLVERSARAGVSSFAGSVAATGTRFECNAIHLVGGETLDGQPPSFDDQGGNTCGCEVEETCAIISASLEPPSPIDP